MNISVVEFEITIIHKARGFMYVHMIVGISEMQEENYYVYAKGKCCKCKWYICDEAFTLAFETNSTNNNIEILLTG